MFHRIDMADFGIADISTTSRNVMYEIAYFNALGTPLISSIIVERPRPFI